MLTSLQTSFHISPVLHMQQEARKPHIIQDFCVGHHSDQHPVMHICFVVTFLESKREYKSTEEKSSFLFCGKVKYFACTLLQPAERHPRGFSQSTAIYRVAKLIGWCLYINMM